MRIELAKAREIAQEKTQKLRELMESSAQREEFELGAKNCIKNILYRASLGTRKLFESSMRASGYIKWLDLE